MADKIPTKRSGDITFGDDDTSRIYGMATHDIKKGCSGKVLIRMKSKGFFTINAKAEEDVEKGYFTDFIPLSIMNPMDEPPDDAGE